MTLQEWRDQHPDVTIHGGGESVLPRVRLVFSKDETLHNLDDYVVCGDPRSQYLMERDNYTIMVKRHQEPT